MNCEHPESARVAIEPSFAWCSRCGSLCDNDWPGEGVWRPPSLSGATDHSIDDDILDNLRSLAERATPGERWISDLDGAIRAGDPGKEIGAVDFGEEDFTLAVTPAVVRMLIDEIQSLRARRTAVMELKLEAARAEADELRVHILALTGHMPDD
jgi:hypothetical protein